MKRFFKWLFFLLAILVVSGTVLLYNPVLIKGPLERYLGGLTGYPVSLGGEIEIDIGRTTILTASNLRISAPAWARQGNLISVGQLDVAVDTGSLFEDVVVIDSVRIEDLKLNLETNADGAGNWVSSNPPPREDTQVSQTKRNPVVIFNSVNLNRNTLGFINGRTGTEHVLNVISFAQQQQPDGMLHIRLEGSFNGQPVKYAGTVGPYVNLLALRDVSVTGNGHFGSLDITGSGLIDDLLQPSRPQFNLELEGPDIDEITGMFGADDLGSGSFSLHARGGEADDHYAAGINGKIGDVSLVFSAQASDLADLHELGFNMAVNGPSLSAFARAFGVMNWPDKPFRLKGNVKRVGQTLNISDLTLDIGGTRLVLDALLTKFPSLQASRARLSISGDEVSQFRELLGIPGIATGPFEVLGKLDVSAQEVELLQVELKTELGYVTVSGTLGDGPNYIGSRLHLHLDGKNAHALMSAFGIDALPEDPFSLDTKIETVEKGLMLERGVLVTIKDERLEMGGLLSYRPGSLGTDVEVRVSGKHLARVLQRLVGETQVPDLPYDVSGHVQVLETGINLDNVRAEVAGNELVVSGLINPQDQLTGTTLDFQLGGKDLSSLNVFPAIGDSLDIIVPGQSYQATGRFGFEDNGWKLDGLKGHIGNTDLGFDGLISNQPQWVGSNIRFSIKGPDLRGLLVDNGESRLPHGKFDTTGQVKLTDGALSITDFNFETAKASGEIDLELGWPVSRASDVRFDADIQGDDIRLLFPPTDLFEPDLAAFHLQAAGEKQGDRISVQHFDADVGGLQVSLKGGIVNDPTNENVNIAISANSSDLSSLGKLHGDRLPALPLDIQADFKGNARQFVLNNFTGTLGRSEVTGNLDVSLAGPRPKFMLTANSSFIDLYQFAQLADVEAETDIIDDLDIATTKSRLIPATDLPLETLSAFDGTFNIRIDKLRHQKDNVRNIVLEASLQDGILKIPELSLSGPRGKLTSSLNISPSDDGNADVSVELSAEKLILNLTGQSQDKLDEVPPFDFKVNVAGRGANFQELAGSLNGSLSAGSPGGTLEGVNLSILDTFILDEIFSLIMPKTDVSDDLNLTCASVIVEITDGLMKTQPALAFTTGQISLAAKGTLDLKTEKMNFNFNATPNNALKISAGELFNPYILVGGTLSDPAVGLDPGKVLIHGGAAVGTAGISILAKGLYDRVANTIPLCEGMLEQVQGKQPPQ